MFPKLSELLRLDGIEVNSNNMCRCWLHDDKKPSMSITDNEDEGGKWFCHTCGVGGNHITYCKKHASPALKARFETGEWRSKGGGKPPPQKSVPAKKEKPAPLPVKHDGLWIFVNEEGAEISAKVRWNTEDGKRFAIYTKTEGLWVKKAPKRRVLWQLDKVVEATVPVLIVEGEKCAEAAQKALGDEYVASAWEGGARGWVRQNKAFGDNAAVVKVEIDALKDKRVVLWADNDKVGVEVMRAFAERIKGLAAEIFLVTAPDGKPAKWDVADAIDDGWDAHTIKEFMYSNYVQYGKPKPPKAELEKASNDFLKRIDDGKHFRVLGYRTGCAVFQIVKSGEVLTISYDRLGQEAIQSIVLCQNYMWWLSLFGGDTEKLTKDKRMTIGSALRELSLRRGRYSTERECGVGVWRAGDRFVINAGNKLIALPEGKDYAFAELSDTKTVFVDGSKHIMAEPAGHEKASQMLDAVMRYRWRSEMDGRIFCGWLVAASVGGALPYRPHIWLGGEFGTGKTYLIEEVAKSLFGKWCLSIVAGSTIAGLRRGMGLTSCPVIYDEAEARGRHADTLRNELASIVRVSSSGEGSIIHGNTSGSDTTTRYTPRSCFCFSSVIQSSLDGATSSRISPVELSHRGVEDWPSVRDAIEGSLEDGAGILSYFLQHTKDIVDACHFGYEFMMYKGATTRRSFQLGTLLGAVAWLAVGETEGEYIDAELERLYTLGLPQDTTRRSEGGMLLSDILGCKVRTGKRERTLLEMAILPGYKDEAADIGLRVIDSHGGADGVLLNCSERNVALANLMKATDYAKSDFYSVLARMPDAKIDKDKLRMFRGRRTRRAVYFDNAALLEHCDIDLPVMYDDVISSNTVTDWGGF